MGSIEVCGDLPENLNRLLLAPRRLGEIVRPISRAAADPADPGGGRRYQPSQQKERCRQPLEIDGCGGQEGLDPHVLQATADSSGESVPGLGLPWNPSERHLWRW